MATVVTTSCRQGMNGYASTLDTMLQQKSPSVTSGAATMIRVDGDAGAENQVLLCFDNLLGLGPGQIPPGAIITLANLTMRTPYASLQRGPLYRMLVDWDSASTWASLGNGVQTDGTEAVTTVALTTGAVNTGDQAFDVTTSLLGAWAAEDLTGETQNAAAQGWLIKAGGTDGWDFRSSEGSVRPLLAVTYMIPDMPPLPVVSIAARTPTSRTEGPNTKISFMVALDLAANQPVMVDYSTINGTAAAGSDFVRISNGLITRAWGETTKIITINPLDDTQAESPKAFTSKINSATNATVSSANNTATGSIAASDVAPSPSGPIVSIQPKDVDTRIEGSGATISFTLTLSEAVDYNVKVRYSTASGTAQEGQDFVALVNQSVTFLPGQMSKTVKVSLLDDAVVENLEAFTIKIDSATNATVSSTNHTATGYIFDNDAPASVLRVFDTTQYRAGDPSGYGSGDPSGLAYIPGKNGEPGTLFIADSEHDESPYFSSTNLLGISLEGNSYNWSSLRSFTKEPTGLAYNPANGYLYITDDDKKKIFWVDPAKPSEKLGEFDLNVIGVKDAEDPVFDPQTGDLYLLDGAAGRLLKLSNTGALLSSVTLPSAISGLTEAEALAYSHRTADGRAVFFVGGGTSSTIFQIDETGKLLSASDILASYINPISGAKPSVKGMEWAPSSDPNDDNEMSLYVADYGVDQQNDGRVFEIDFGAGWLIA